MSIIKEFPLSVIEKLDYYVYLLIDPGTNQFFYIGKSTRVSSTDALFLFVCLECAKLQRIFASEQIHFTRQKKLIETIERKIKKSGYTVEINRPFAGAFVPSAYYKKDKQVAALMIEVNRRLYMDKESATRSENFNRVQKHVKELMSEANGWFHSIEEV